MEYRCVEAKLRSGENLLHELPSTYQSYRIEVFDGVTLTADDLNTITQWSHAKVVQIIGAGDTSNFDVVRSLQQFDLAKLKKLTDLTVTISPSNYVGLDVKPFLNLPDLVWLRLDVRTLTTAQADEIIKSQRKFENYSHEIKNGQIIYTYHRSYPSIQVDIGEYYY